MPTENPSKPRTVRRESSIGESRYAFNLITDLGVTEAARVIGVNHTTALKIKNTGKCSALVEQSAQNYAAFLGLQSAASGEATALIIVRAPKKIAKQVRDVVAALGAKSMEFVE